MKASSDAEHESSPGTRLRETSAHGLPAHRLVTLVLMSEQPMLSKVIRHVRSGDLWTVTKRKVRQTVVGNTAVGDCYYGDAATAYEERRRGTEYWESQQRIAEELIARFDDGLTVLDVPFGTGRFAEIYARKRMDVVGIEASEDMIDAARQERGDLIASFDVRVGDARSLPLDDSSVDLVICFRFLTDIIPFGDAKQVIAEIRRVTRDAAILDLGFRDPALPPRKRLPRPSERMSVLLTEEQVRDLLAEAGFEVESISQPYGSREGYRAAVTCRAVSPE